MELLEYEPLPTWGMKHVSITSSGGASVFHLEEVYRFEGLASNLLEQNVRTSVLGWGWWVFILGAEVFNEKREQTGKTWQGQTQAIITAENWEKKGFQ